MARLRFVAVALLALALAGNSTQTGRSAGQAAYPEPHSREVVALAGAAVDAARDKTCVIYALGNMGYDADLGKWIAQTIPEVIEPGSWKEAGVLRYYAPKNILIVNQSKKIQYKVDAFLKNLKTSLPNGKETHAAARTTAPHGRVVLAAHGEPALLRDSSQPPESSSYPVPAPVKVPKHLFHFIIRYEGEGIIDDNVVKFMKVQTQAEKKDKSDEEASERGYYQRHIGNHEGGPSSWSNPPSATSASGAKERDEKATPKKEKADPQP